MFLEDFRLVMRWDFCLNFGCRLLFKEGHANIKESSIHWACGVQKGKCLIYVIKRGSLQGQMGIHDTNFDF